MRRPRCTFFPRVSGKVAMAALKGDKSMSEFIVQFELHFNYITQFRQHVMTH